MFTANGIRFEKPEGSNIINVSLAVEDASGNRGWVLIDTLDVRNSFDRVVTANHINVVVERAKPEQEQS